MKIKKLFPCEIYADTEFTTEKTSDEVDGEIVSKTHFFIWKEKGSNEVKLCKTAQEFFTALLEDGRSKTVWFHNLTADFGTSKAIEKVKDCDQKQLMEDTQLDAYTLKDILDAICQPLRDYRDQYDAPILRKDVLEMEDLHIHDQLEGTVRNVVDFGAFVDIGLHEDGLVHISKMSKNRVKHPSDVVSVGDIVTVWVYNIDQEKQKVQLTMVNPI